MTPPPDIRERLAKMGPFIADGLGVYGGTVSVTGWNVGCAYGGLPNIPPAELAALIAQLLNEYVATLPAARE